MWRYIGAICLLWGGVAQAQTLLETLPNGMKVLVHEDQRSPVVSVRLWYQVGSVDEETGKTGLSHALEHMMFKGTPSLPSGEFNRRISALGGINNAYTNRTETVYTTEIAAKHLPQVLQMEADRMVNLNFSDKDFVNEMSVIREERRQRTDDSPYGKMWENIHLKLWQRANNQAPIIGFMNDLHTLKASDLREWYQKWYAPNNAMLVVVGDVKAQETVQAARLAFGNIAAQTLPNRQDELEQPNKSTAPAAPSIADGIQTQEIEAVTNQPIISVAWRVPRMQNIHDEQAHALEMLAAVLSGTSAARYPKKLVRGEAIALNASAAYYDFGRQNALFLLTAMPAATMPSANVNQNPHDWLRQNTRLLQNKLLQEIKDIAENGVSEAELKRIRQPLQTERIFAKDSIRTQADTLGTLENNGFGWQSEEILLQNLLKVTPQQVQTAAKMLLDTQALATWVMPASSNAK
ncbi:MAG: pitrilysin family protein [Neisseria sp.]|nr:pitrilysin family protein [Neisseria sp.]